MKKLFVVLMICLCGSVLFAQSDLTGKWHTGKENTLVKIYETKGEYFGEIVSSDNPKVQIGKKIVKDLKNKKGKWKGKLFAVKKQEWVDAEFKPKNDILEITVKVGFFTKTVEWNKVKTEMEDNESDKDE